MVGDPAFVGVYSSASTRWYPTNAATACIIWCETVPFVTTQGGNVDGSSVGFWTNLISGVAGPGNLTADTGIPVFHSTGGGADGNEPRVFFTTNSIQRFITGVKTETSYTIMMVMQISNTVQSTSGKIIALLYNAGVAPFMQYNNKALELNQSITVTGPATITNSNWMIITSVFNGASSSITTNGVAYVSGNTGSGSAGTGGYYINNGSYSGGFWPLSGNISRIWAWANALSAGDTTSAITQCKTDFGIH